MGNGGTAWVVPILFSDQAHIGSKWVGASLPTLGLLVPLTSWLGHQDLDFASKARCPPLKICKRGLLGILSILSQAVKASGAGTRTRSRIVESGRRLEPAVWCVAWLCVCAHVCVWQRESELAAVNWPRTSPGLCLGTPRSTSAPGTLLLNRLQIHSLSQPRQRGEHSPEQREHLFILLGSVFKGSGSAPLNQRQAHRQTP